LLLGRFAFVFPIVANISVAIANIPSHVAPITPDVARVAGDLSAILAQLLLRRVAFFVGAQVTNIRPASTLILTNVPAIVANIAGVVSNIPTISMQVFAFRPSRSGNPA
jgi:hypothetical protein